MMSILFFRSSRLIYVISDMRLLGPVLELRKVFALFKRTTIVLLDSVLVFSFLVSLHRVLHLRSDWTAPPRFLLHSVTSDRNGLWNRRHQRPADVVDSEPSLARSLSPFDRRIAPHARPSTVYGRLCHQLLRTDSDIDSTSGRSIWNADSTADKYWQLWTGTDIRSASRQFYLIRQFDASVIQCSRSVRVKSCLFTPEALGGSRLPLGSSATR